jgi:hypothetical protein
MPSAAMPALRASKLMHWCFCKSFDAILCSRH